MPQTRIVALGRSPVLLGVILSLLVGSLLPVRAQSVTLAWDPPSDPSVVGYRVHYGTSSGSYYEILDVTSTTATISNLTVGDTYFFVVTSLNAAGLESLYSNQVSFAAVLKPITPVALAENFNGGQSSDLLWRNSRSGAVAIWLMNGTSISQSAVIGKAGLNWQILGVGDFTGQGNSDLLWSNPSTGELAIWFMNGVSVTGRQAFFLHGVRGAVQAIGDLSGYGLADLIVRDSGTGNTWVLRNLGPPTPNFAVSWFGKVPTSWVIAGLADVAGNGAPQLIWRNKASGQVQAWYFSNGVPSATTVIGSANPSWVIKAFGDVNGNHHDDIIVQHSATGAVAVWDFNGPQISGAAILGRVGQSWLLGTRAHCPCARCPRLTPG